MRRSEWSDRELEELLRQMPKIQDLRDPRDIYQNLSFKRRKTRPWLVPSFAAAAALLLFFILIPRIMDQSNSSLDQATVKKSEISDKASQSSEQKEFSIALNKESDLEKNEVNSGVNKKDEVETSQMKTALYEEEMGNSKVLTYWIPDQQALNLIPVSILVPDAKDQPLFPLFNEKMASLKEADWGLTDYYPLKLTMKMDEANKVLQADLPADHPYGQGSSNEGTFLNVLKNDMASNSAIREIKFSTDGVPGIELGNYGKTTDLPVETEKRHAYFFYYPKGSDLPFLTPSKETYTDVKTAFEAMKSDQTEKGLKRSIAPLLPIHEVTTMDKTLVVSLTGNSSLQDVPLTVYSFEAVLMTAKEFGLDKVLVKDAPLTQIGEFNLTKENKVPIAPNLRTIQ